MSSSIPPAAQSSFIAHHLQREICPIYPVGCSHIHHASPHIQEACTPTQNTQCRAPLRSNPNTFPLHSIITHCPCMHGAGSAVVVVSNALAWQGHNVCLCFHMTHISMSMKDPCDSLLSCAFPHSFNTTAAPTREQSGKGRRGCFNHVIKREGCWQRGKQRGIEGSLELPQNTTCSYMG
jgi:hypothetical protein